MTDDSGEKPTEFVPTPNTPAEVNLKDLLSGLDLTPKWGTPASGGGVPFTGGGGRARDDRRDDRRERRPGSGRPDSNGRDRSSDRPDRGPRREGSGGGARGDRPAARRPASTRPEGGARERERPPQREVRPFLPVEVSFIPDRDRLGAVVHHLHAFKRAFPLPYLAQLFLTKPEYHLIKLEVKAGHTGEPLEFFQDRERRQVFLSLDELNDYLVRKHLDRHFDREEQVVEPPGGNFVCVGQCRRTGTILGPPNYHGYNERLMQIHRTHFPHMTLDQYRGTIEMVRDPAVIEKWKDECRTQVRYKLKEIGENAQEATPSAPPESPETESTAEPVHAPDTEAMPEVSDKPAAIEESASMPATLTLAQAEALFLERFAASYRQSGSKIILPATNVNQLSDERLRYTINGARAREDRFPFSMMLAVRPAFRRMRLHMFKVGKDETYVTAIPPKAMDAEHAIPVIKQMVNLIAEHPGWSRAKLFEAMHPGKTEADAEVQETLGQLVWLIDKGHVIEFFNGSCAIPGHLRMNESVPTEKPDLQHHPDLEAAPKPASAAYVITPLEAESVAPTACEELPVAEPDQVDLSAEPASEATPPLPSDLPEPVSSADTPASDEPSQY